VQRRGFIKTAFTAGVSLPMLNGYSQLWANEAAPIEKLTILHTNDTHSRIDAFESGEFKGLGGVASRKTLIDKVRAVEQNVLLLDAGDIFQGTPYFNMYNGELEMKAMTYLSYDAATIGNHDFDNGSENLATQMKHAQFPFVVSNYQVKNSVLSSSIAPYVIFNKGKIKVGVFGLGIELDGLVAKKNYGDIIYDDPIISANKITQILKNDEKCDIIICLSHLGYIYKEKKVSDIILAQEVDHLDIILGGHTHTFLDCPKLVQKSENKFVIVNQVGWGGVTLGRLDIYFDKEKNRIEKNIANLLKCHI
jgi:5'-nucleotidase